MKVAHIINNFGFGGAETRLLETVKSSASHRIEPVVISLDGTGPLEKEFRTAAKVIDLRARKLAAPHQAGVRLFRLLGRLAPDVVHTHLVMSGIIGRSAARLAQVPVVVSTQHNAYYPKERTYRYRLERELWNLADGMIAISECTREYLERGGFRGPIRVVLTGVEVVPMPDISSQHEHQPYLLAVGHFRDDQKGHDILLEAFRQISPRFPSLRLLIAGEGHLRPKFEELARNLGIASKTSFLGGRGDVAGLMRGAELFALSSRWEGFGRVIIEAMANGAPVIATAVEAIPEIVRNGVNGLLVPPGEPSALAGGITMLLESPALRRQLARAGLATARERHSAVEMVASEADFYATLLARGS